MLRGQMKAHRDMLCVVGLGSLRPGWLMSSGQMECKIPGPTDVQHSQICDILAPLPECVCGISYSAFATCFSDRGERELLEGEVAHTGGVRNALSMV